MVTPSRRRVVLVYAHPLADSLTAAVRDRALAALDSAGHEVTVCDLYGDGFDPLYRPGADTGDDPVLARHLEALITADTLVAVHPTWWGGLPAIVKGWFDRLLPALPARRLRHIRRVVVVTTHGSPRWQNLVEGHAGRLWYRRGLRTVVHPLARVSWIALYDVDRSELTDRRAFLDRVERRLARL